MTRKSILMVIAVIAIAFVVTGCDYIGPTDPYEAPLSCRFGDTLNNFGIVLVNDLVYVHAVDGHEDWQLRWFASGGSPSTGSGREFHTRYSSPGIREITVSRVRDVGDAPATCQIDVR